MPPWCATPIERSRRAGTRTSGSCWATTRTTPGPTRVPGGGLRDVSGNTATERVVADAGQSRWRDGEFRDTDRRLLRHLHAATQRRGRRDTVGDGGLLLVRLRKHSFHLPRVVRNGSIAVGSHGHMAAERSRGDIGAVGRRVLASSAVLEGVAQLRHRNRAGADAPEPPAGAGGGRSGSGPDRTQPRLRAVGAARWTLRHVDDAERLDEDRRRERARVGRHAVSKSRNRANPASRYGVRGRRHVCRDQRRHAESSGDVRVDERPRIAGARHRRHATGRSVPGFGWEHPGQFHASQGGRGVAAGGPGIPNAAATSPTRGSDLDGRQL